jgi:SpoIIAA-like
MAMTIDRPSDGVLSVSVTGAWTASEWTQAQAALAEAVRQLPDVRSLLVIVESFLGWKGDGWDDLSAQATLDQQIERLAIVGEQKWEDLILMFAGQGLRRIEIKYFPAGELDEARRWLTAGSAPGTVGRTR